MHIASLHVKFPCSQNQQNYLPQMYKLYSFDHFDGEHYLLLFAIVAKLVLVPSGAEVEFSLNLENTECAWKTWKSINCINLHASKERLQISRRKRGVQMNLLLSVLTNRVSNNRAQERERERERRTPQEKKKSERCGAVFIFNFVSESRGANNKTNHTAARNIVCKLSLFAQNYFNCFCNAWRKGPIFIYSLARRKITSRISFFNFIFSGTEESV
jgi:hypothetical protein